MARTIKTRVRSALPGAGFDSSGNPKQGKRQVNGEISVTSYVSGGESLTAADLGLATIDFIKLVHSDGAAGTEGKGVRSVPYCFATADFYIVQDIGLSGMQPATGSTHTVYFEAKGDALDGIELT